MPQNQSSGADGNLFGRENARRLAAAIRATVSSKTSNEARFEGRLTVLKSARKRTSSVGVTYRMLARLDSVIAAFQEEDGRWSVFELDAAVFGREERPTRSQGPSEGRVGIVAKSIFLRYGRSLGTFRLQ